jgi:predicted kinase
MNFNKIKQPFVMILIGPPLSGKTFFYNSFISEFKSAVKLISRDNIVMEIYGSRNYTEAFQKVNHKEVDRVLDKRLKEANLSKENVIVDMTHMTSKRRKQNLNYFSDDFYKLAVIFPILEEEEYERRNSKRIAEENKDLPIHVIRSMISSYQTIKDDEGFDRIISYSTIS